MVDSSNATAGQARSDSAALLEDALFQIKRVIVGHDRMVERALVCLLARGHCLIEGVPGPGQDAHGVDDGAGDGRDVRPPPVHA